MAYRLDNTPPPNPEDMLRRFAVRNGATLKLTFKCFYTKPGHSPHWHDHVNWPAPNYHPGDVCNMPGSHDFDPRLPFPRLLQIKPIHLIEEGYGDLHVVFEDEDLAQYVTVTSLEIDEDDDNVVNMTIDSSFPFSTFDKGKPIDLRFTVYADRSVHNLENGTDQVTRDAMAHCFVTVLPARPYSS